MKWYCIHATCSCGESGILQEAKGNTTIELQTSTAANMKNTVVVLSSAAMLLMTIIN